MGQVALKCFGQYTISNIAFLDQTEFRFVPAASAAAVHMERAINSLFMPTSPSLLPQKSAKHKYGMMLND